MQNDVKVPLLIPLFAISDAQSSKYCIRDTICIDCH